MDNIRSRVSLFALAAVVALTLSACSSADVTYPSAQPDGVGVATAVDPRDDGTVTFVLTGTTDGELLSDAVIMVGPDTVVGDEAGRPIDPTVLVAGTQMSVWADVCTRSLPPQCQATAIRVEGV